jgi:hypothetical protein
MKKLINFFRWLFGINLILISLGGFMSSEFLIAIVILIIGLLLIPPVWDKLRNKPSTVTVIENDDVNQYSVRNNLVIHKQPGYFPEDVQNAVKQILETVNIMMNSKSIDTIQGRCEFFKGRFQTILEARKSPRYETDLQNGLDFYKTLFYNTAITQTQIDIVTKPHNFNFDKFYIECLLKGYESFLEEQLIAIYSMKRADSKKRRIKKEYPRK